MHVSMAHDQIFYLWYINELQTPTYQRYHHWKRSTQQNRDALRKATSITKEDNIANSSIWHMRGYEELISNRIASLAYLGLMNH